MSKSDLIPVLLLTLLVTGLSVASGMAQEVPPNRLVVNGTDTSAVISSSAMPVHGDCGEPRRGGFVHTCATLPEAGSPAADAELKMSRPTSFAPWFVLVSLAWRGSWRRRWAADCTQNQGERAATSPVVVWMWRKLEWCVVDWG